MSYRALELRLDLNRERLASFLDRSARRLTNTAQDAAHRADALLRLSITRGQVSHEPPAGPAIVQTSATVQESESTSAQLLLSRLYCDTPLQVFTKFYFMLPKLLCPLNRFTSLTEGVSQVCAWRVHAERVHYVVRSVQHVMICIYITMNMFISS